jgi:hypothetical protein
MVWLRRTLVITTPCDIIFPIVCEDVLREGTEVGRQLLVDGEVVKRQTGLLAHDVILMECMLVSVLVARFSRYLLEPGFPQIHHLHGTIVVHFSTVLPLPVERVGFVWPPQNDTKGTADGTSYDKLSDVPHRRS